MTLKRALCLTFAGRDEGRERAHKAANDDETRDTMHERDSQ